MLITFQIRDFYWGQEIDINNPKGLVDAISDSSYAHPVDTAAKIHAMKSKADVSWAKIRYFKLFQDLTLNIADFHLSLWLSRPELPHSAGC